MVVQLTTLTLNGRGPAAPDNVVPSATTPADIISSVKIVDAPKGN